MRISANLRKASMEGEELARNLLGAEDTFWRWQAAVRARYPDEVMEAWRDPGTGRHEWRVVGP